MDSLPRDILIKIYNFLPLIYKITFARACATVWRGTSPADRDVGARIRDVSARKYSIGLYDTIFTNGLVIIGSFLHDILFETNHCNGMDVLLSTANLTPNLYPVLSNMLHHPAYIKFTLCMKNLRYYQFLVSDGTPRFPHPNSTICKKHFYDSDGPTVTLFFIGFTLQNFINSMCFEFNRFYYDVNGLKVSCLKSLLAQSSRIDLSNYSDKYQQKIKKYSDRGFSFE